MRFLAALRHAGYARYLQSSLRELCGRGHEVVVLVGIQAPTSKSHAGLLQRFAAELDDLAEELEGRLTIRPGVEARGSRHRDLGGSLRSWLDYLHFREPAFDDAPKLRARSLSNLPAALREPTEEAAASPEFRASLAAMIRMVERSLPVHEPARALLAEERPDAVVVCPLIERRSPQVAYLRAAHELGIPGALCVASWDNLTTSSLIHGEPDLVTVWNEAQRVEAVDIHGIPAERVAVTGAPLYDRWFEQEPSTSLEEFCGRVGLPADRPFVLYVCSSGFIAPEEAAWIPEWLDAVRGSGAPELADVPVLIRPHPQHRLLKEASSAARLQSTPGVVIHPREGELTMSGSEVADYYDSIHHSAAVVGVNTSAMIESAIVGRGVHVLLTKRYQDTQEGLPHFAHLRASGGGLIETTRKERQHASRLARAVRGDDRDQVAERSRRFLEAFIRPQGLDRPSTPLMADQLEALAERSPPPVEPPADPPGEQLQAAVAALEPIFRLQSANRSAPSGSGSKEAADDSEAGHRRRGARRRSKRAGATQRTRRRSRGRGP